VKLFLAVLVLLCVPLVAVAPPLAPPADDVQLSIKGDTKVVKVPRVITVLDDVTVVGSLPFTVHAPKGGAIYTWSYPPALSVTKKGDTLQVNSAPKGNLTISVEVVNVDWDKRQFVTTFGEVSFAVGDVVPPEPGPLPPDPTPPGPTPTPIPTDKPRVLVLYEKDDLIKLNQSQRDLLYGEELWNYARAKLPKEGPKNYPTCRIWDKDVQFHADFAKESPVWQEWFKRARTSTPWLIVSVPGKGGWEGPLPADGAAIMAKLKQYLE